MRFQMYSIRDDLTGFMTPVLEQSEASARRNFQMAMDRSDSLMSYHPSDFALYHIADFDSESGEIFPVAPPALVLRGSRKDG